LGVRASATGLRGGRGRNSRNEWPRNSEQVTQVQVWSGAPRWWPTAPDGAAETMYRCGRGDSLASRRDPCAQALLAGRDSFPINFGSREVGQAETPHQLSSPMDAYSCLQISR